MLADLNSLLTVAQAARRTEYISEAALRHHIAGGELAVVRLGKNIFIPIDALEDFLKRQGVKG